MPGVIAMHIYGKIQGVKRIWTGIGVVCLLLLWGSHAFSGAPEIREKCLDNESMNIATIYDTSTNGFAEVRMIPFAERYSAKQRGVSPFTIHVNPKLYYLSQYTQQWLFHRQCIFIREFTEQAMQRDRRIDMGLEQHLDCRAIQHMQSDPGIAISPRQVQSIERDMERVLRDNRWNEVLAGPERRITLMKCN